MNHASLRFLALIGLLVAVPATSFAQTDPTTDTGGGPSRNFGLSGQLAISSDAGLSLEHVSPGGLTRITLYPAADYFIGDNISLGGFIGLTYTTTDGGSQTRFAIGPRVGYNIRLSDLISVWPKIGFSFSTTSSDVDAGENVEVTTSDNSGIALNLFVPLMFHPAQHFFAGFGPFLDTDLSGDDKVTSFGLRLTIGGWLDT